VREALTASGLSGAAKTSGSKGIHVLVPVVEDTSVEDAMAVTRALAARTERLDPASVTTAFLKEERHGKVYADPTRSGGASLACAYSPRARPGVPVSFPVAWGDLDRVTPSDFTVRTAPGLLGKADPWRDSLPAPQPLPADLVAEGKAIPIPRVVAMHEGKRRARARRETPPPP
jgi:DNA primase